MTDKLLVNVIPDPQDPEDYLYEWNTLDIIPELADLRQHTGMVENQLSVGSCTANALVGACEMFLIANGVFKDTTATDPLDLSRLFNYKLARSYLSQNLQDNDLGSIMRYNLKAANKYGVCSEQLHPYSVSAWNAVPSQTAYTDALKRKIGGYYRVPSIGPNWSYYPMAKAIKHAVAKGFPVLVSMLVGERIRTLTPDQEYPYVHPINNPQIGGHALVVVGYTPTHFIMRNSWGDNWCDHGYFKCAFDVLVNDSMDVWVVQGFSGFGRCGVDLVIPHVNDAVTMMYLQALHRMPDASGLAYWKTQTTRAAMKGICSSDEFFMVNRSISDLYKSILGREADAGGLAHWTNTGWTLRAIAAEFMKSAEFEAKYNNGL